MQSIVCQKVREYLKVVRILLGQREFYTNMPCFVCEWDRPPLEGNNLA